MKKITTAVRSLCNRLRRKASHAIHTVSGHIHAARAACAALAAPFLFQRSAFRVITQKSGEGFVDTALKILISVVVGALILAGLYALFGDTILPSLTRRITELFNYAG